MSFLGGPEIWSENVPHAPGGCRFYGWLAVRPDNTVWCINCDHTSELT